MESRIVLSSVSMIPSAGPVAPIQANTTTATITSSSATPSTTTTSTPVFGPASTLGTASAVVAQTQSGDFASLDPSTGLVNFTLAEPAVVTAGIFNAQGNLVRTLFSVEPLSAGEHSVLWDGHDDSGDTVPGGSYAVHIIVNRDTYTNVGAIGDDATNPNTASHTPVSILSVAVDSSGAIYTANGWDEAGADFKKWDASGNSVYDANFAIRNGDPNGVPYKITTDDTYMYLTVGAWDGEMQVQRFRLSDGMAAPFTGPGVVNGHIEVYSTTDGLVPAGTSAADAAIMGNPLQSLAVSGNTLYVADAAGNRVLMYDKSSGAPLGQFAVTLPQAIAVDGSGNIWVDHEHGILTVFGSDGQPIGDAAKGLGEVGSLAFGPSGNLYVANTTAGQVQIYAVDGIQLTLAQTLGQLAKPGDGDPSDFFNLRGATVDSSGNIITVQTQPAGGAQIAKWAPDGTLIWYHFSNEFGGLGNYGQDNPDQFYSASFHSYTLTDAATGSWQYNGVTAPSNVSTYNSGLHGVPRVLNIGGQDFYFLPTGDGLQVYRIDGSAFHLATLVGGRDPAPDGSMRTSAQGEWTWSDTTGTGQPTSSEFTWFKPQGQSTYNTYGMNVDAEGNLWYADQTTKDIWEIPMGPLDVNGNPTYNWGDARQVVAPDTSSTGFTPQTVQRADDGSLYVIGNTTQNPLGNSPLWMGGTTLAKYDSDGQLLWMAKLPEISTGIDVIPGGSGGVMIGGGTTSTVYQYTSDGLLIGIMKPGAALNYTSGWFDNQASVAVNRNPNDGMLDIFTEDDYGLHIGWFRVDDSQTSTLEIAVSPPAALTTVATDLAAAASSNGQIVLSWTTIASASSYGIERSTDGTNWTVVGQVAAPTPGGSAALSFVDTSVNAGTTYSYRIQGQVGESTLPYSAVVASTSVVTTVAKPLASDTFSGDALGPNWSTNAGNWQVSDGVLSQTSLDYADPKKAIMSVPTSSQDLMITAKVMVNPGSDVNSTRAGVGLSTDPTTGRGYNMIFYGQNTVAFLNDGVAWGNGYSFNWSVGTWYWFKLERVGDTLYGKVWADGSAEPSGWMFTQTGWSDRTSGSPALNGGTVQSTASFADVSIDMSVGDTTELFATPTTSSQVVLTWSPIAGASSYQVERSVDGTNWSPVGQYNSPSAGVPSMLSMADAGLDPDTTYQYRIRGQDASGSYLPYSEVITATTASLATTSETPPAPDLTESDTSTTPAPLASDTFSGDALGPNWSTNAGNWQVSDGVLSQTSLDYADPKKAILSVPTSSQDLIITAKVRVDQGTDVNSTRAGVGLSTDPTTGRGYNMIFYGQNTVAFLNDGVAWGNGYSFNWSVGTWYWFKLERVGDTLYGKVWADGSAEPSGWMFTQTGWSDRTSGSPALNGGTVQSVASFADVSIDTSVDGTTEASDTSTDSNTTTTNVETTRFPDTVSSNSSPTTTTTVPVVTTGGGSVPTTDPTTDSTNTPLTTTPTVATTTAVASTAIASTTEPSGATTEESTTDPVVRRVVMTLSTPATSTSTGTTTTSSEPAVTTPTTLVASIPAAAVTTESSPTPVVTGGPSATSDFATVKATSTSSPTTTTPTPSTTSAPAASSTPTTPASSPPASAFRFLAGLGRNLKSTLASLGGRKYGPRIVVRAMPTGHHFNAAGNRNAIAAKALGQTGIQTAKRPTPKPVGWPTGHG